MAYLIEQTVRLDNTEITTRNLAETAVYALLVTLLAASATAYLLARIGYLERIKVHRRQPRSTIDDYFDKVSPTLTVIVPSYREDVRVIRQTLLSAALQEYRDLRVVLLVDDPPNATDPEHRRGLERARAVPDMIMDSLREPARLAMEACEAFEREPSAEYLANAATLDVLAGHYERAAEWFESEKETLPRVDHSDEFLVIEVFERMRNDLRTTAEAIRAAIAEPQPSISRRRVRQLYQRLVNLFTADVTSFERKQFASLSHESNKAMNLNSYLGLMGGSYKIASSPGGKVLVSAEGQAADLTVPDPDYVLTLDADSVLLPEYCLRLVYFMEQEENADVAVAQTPYSSFLGASSAIERIAGATTDIQHIVHQGLTHHDATFWVGANAVIRKRALDELEEKKLERGFVVSQYIKDRTVIEDTESSIDLRARGWRLYNYPERLSYSATPSDFGSLVIQRQRWSNGGLLILPGLLKLCFRRRNGVARPRLGELFLRTNYLASISWASLSLILLLFYPFDGQLLSHFALVTALPYFWAMANDLRRTGYHRRDVFAVYAFNLLLLPVNLVGTIQSVMQAIGGHKIPFARTPKVKNRTIAPLLFVVLPLLLIGWSGHTLVRDIQEGTYYHGVFAGVNLLATVFACIFLMGLRGMVVDVAANVHEFVRRPIEHQNAEQDVPYWASVLYVGSSVPEAIEQSGPLAVALAARDRFELESAAMPAEYLTKSKARQSRGGATTGPAGAHG